jgi:protein-tyrosine kinase
MSILEALEKAKRMRAEKTRDADGKEAADAATPVRRRRLEVVPAPVATLNYARASIDLAVCENNRVLIAAESRHPNSRVEDSYRILRTRLQHRFAAEKSATFGVISAGPGEGKSLTAINLALSFASEKRRNVFLLDLDLRSPRLCRYLGVSPPIEVGTCLAHTARPEEVFFTTEIDNLVMAGGVTSHGNSSELLGGSGLVELLEYIRTTDPYALVIVDMPPVLQSADAMVIAPHLTAMLLVVAEGLTRRDQLSRATEVLSGTTVAGVVLNRSREAIEHYYG